jgi:hypothetical protein
MIVKNSRQNGQKLQLTSVLLLSLLQANFYFSREELNELHVALKAKGDCSLQVRSFGANGSLCRHV